MSPVSSASGSRWALSPRATLALLVSASLLARIVLGAWTPLLEDEAYDRLWSLRPAFGYFDHPPMIAWWIWVGRQLVGDNAGGVRFLPTLGATLATFVTFDIARLLGLGERVAARAAVWLNATFLIGLGAFLAAPDAPNTLFWTLTVWCALKALRGAPAWWLAAGVTAGLACLSKYSGLFLAPGVLLWLALSADGRKALRTPWPWLAALIAALVFAPNVIWNAQHGWETFAKQFGRARVTGLAPLYLAKFAFDQFVLLNPLIAVFVALAVRRRAAWPLLALAAPFAAYLAFHSLHDAVQGQWPAPLYPLLAIAAAAAAERVGPRLALLRTAAPWVGYIGAALAFAWILAPMAPPFRDPMLSVRGWPAFYADVERDRLAAGAAWVGASNYGLTAMLADSPVSAAPAVEIVERQRYSFETPAERADFTKPGVVFEPVSPSAAPMLQACFASVEPLPLLQRGPAGHPAVYAPFRVAAPKVDVERDGCPNR